MKLRIATRRSKLALTQTRWVADQLCRLTPELEIEEILIVTKGDQVTDIPLNDIGGKGLFVTEVETAVLDGRADLAVHSLKDMPAQISEGLTLACVPKREDPRDVLLSKDGRALNDLHAGAIVGTGSLRRRIQLYGLRNDLAYTGIRGNVDTRIAKLERGEFDAIVLAYAGLRRLGLFRRPLWIFPREDLIPAVGQGLLAIETRKDDKRVKELVAPLNHRGSLIEMLAERAFLLALGGDCNVPQAAHAFHEPGSARLRIDAMVGSVSTRRQLRAGIERYFSTSPDLLETAAQEMGKEIANSLLSQGANRMIAEARQWVQDPRTAPS